MVAPLVQPDAAGPHGTLSRRHLRMPHVGRGMAVGLLGGSFNPPHEGHVLVAETALRTLGLRQLWWIVTPGNPLKAGRGLAPLSERVAMSEKLASDPRIKVTAFEAAHETRYTADMLRMVRNRNAGVDFVWVMGADNLAQFHRWQDWRGIAASMPIAVIDRPGSTLAFMSAPAAKFLDHARIDEKDAALLPRLDPPAWTFIHGPRSSLSSTAIRRARDGEA